MKIKYFLYLLTGVSSTTLLSANPALAQSTEEINNILRTTNFVLLLVMGASAAIVSFNSSINGAKLVARGSPVFENLSAPLCTSFVAVLIILAGGIILEQWNFAFTWIVAANGGLFLVNLMIALHRFYLMNNIDED